MKRILKVTAAAALLLMAFAPSAKAQFIPPPSAATTLNITANVITGCIMSATPIAFGSVDAILLAGGNNYYGNGAINIQCASGYTVATGLEFDGGRNSAAAATLAVADGTFTALRAMSDGASVLAYDIFEDAGHTLQIAISSAVTLLPTGIIFANAETPYVYTVYGVVPGGSGQTGGPSGLSQGVYNDAVYVTLN